MIKYIEEIRDTFLKIEINDYRHKTLSFDKAIALVVKEVIARSKKGNKVIFIGNEGSASIASHLTIDFLKNANIPAVSFNDSSLLTCIGNDLGYEYVFQKPIEMLSKKMDILFSISSSGRSKNILNATKKAKEKGCFIITLSGFDRDNPLRRLGDINFYVPSNFYGYVEIIHLVICHCIVDTIINNKH